MVKDKGLGNTPSLFFILGRGRSGTTLVSKMLSAHSQVTVAPEGFFILSLWPKYRSKRWTKRVIESFCQDLYKENRIKTWQLPYERVKKALIEASGVQNLTFSIVCRLVYKVYAEIHGGPVVWVGDKNPHYALFARELLTIFPEAPIIYLMRDYRTNIQSYQHVPFDLQDTAALAYRWKIYNEAILQVANRHQSNFYHLPFEELLNKPTAYLNEICYFLKITYEPEMLEFYRYESDNFYGKGSPWFDKLNQPLKTEESQKVSQLSTPELNLAKAICMPTCLKLGYEEEAVKTRLSFRNWWKKAMGLIKGKGMVMLEKLLFYYLPFSLKMLIINRYRKETGGRI